MCIVSFGLPVPVGQGWYLYPPPEVSWIGDWQTRLPGWGVLSREEVWSPITHEETASKSSRPCLKGGVHKNTVLGRGCVIWDDEKSMHVIRGTHQQNMCAEVNRTSFFPSILFLPSFYVILFKLHLIMQSPAFVEFPTISNIF